MRSVLVGLLVVAGACVTPAPTAAPSPPAVPAAVRPPPGAGELHLVFTTDEHGWLEPLVDAERKVQRGGVLALAHQLTHGEGYRADAAGRAQGWLLLSSGDMWTGPYETTLLEGAPMVAAMRRLGYAAASVGNHDYDFGVRVLGGHAEQAGFPFLAANLIETATGELPRWARPFTIVEAGGLKVGIVGLTNADSPTSTDPKNLMGLAFLPYVETLEKWVPRARAAGADEVVVLIHEELAHADELLPVFRRLRVRAAAFGHHHVSGARIDDAGTPELDDDVAVCNGGAYLRSFCRVDLRFAEGKLAAREVRVTPVETPAGAPPPTDDPELAALVARAEENAQRIGGEVLVESKRALVRGADGALGQLVVDAWLQALPFAQVAVTNLGGLRQDLAAGPVRVRDVVSVLPFNNYLLVVELTGAQLREVLANDESVAAGVRYTYSEGPEGRRVGALSTVDGKPIADGARLKVVINDFMYRGGDHYTIARLDAEPEETAIDWREPVLRTLRELGRQHQTLDLVPDARARKR